MSLTFPKLLTVEETAKILGVSKGTLDQWRFHQRYPLKYVKVGGSVRYKESDILDFIKSRTQT